MMGKLTAESVARLASAGGQLIGIGDYRLQKSGAYGEYQLVNSDDVQWKQITETEGREVQDQAIAEPMPYDESTAELLTWFEHEAQRREQVLVGRGNGEKNRVKSHAKH
jgi:hypothetical protein